MSGLYNLVFGDGHEGQRGSLAVSVLGLRAEDIGRFRDAWVEKDGNGGTRFAIYTRNGGRNREAYAFEIRAMRGNKFYVSDADDTFDNTYATFYFRVPGDSEVPSEGWPALRKRIIEAAEPEPVNMDAAWQTAITAMDQRRR